MAGTYHFNELTLVREVNTCLTSHQPIAYYLDGIIAPPRLGSSSIWQWHCGCQQRTGLTVHGTHHTQDFAVLSTEDSLVIQMRVLCITLLFLFVMLSANRAILILDMEARYLQLYLSLSVTIEINLLRQVCLRYRSRYVYDVSEMKV